MTRNAALKAPFPWFGGKSRVAHLVWERFGEGLRNYVEPFFGSGAVLLGRPDAAKIETVNDANAHLANFWRALCGDGADPDAVAHYADWPVSEADLHSRHRWLVETAAERLERVKTDPDYFDAKVAGWWVWGQCLWIGSGWCSRPEWTGRGSGARGPRGALSINSQAGDPIDGHERRPAAQPQGINAPSFGKLPNIAGRDAGRGAFAKSRSGHRHGDAEELWQPRPDLTSGTGRGIITEKLPLLGGESKGVNAVGLTRKRPALTGSGGGVGVHKPSLGAAGWQKRPVLQHGEGGRGVHRLAHQVPDLSGDSGAVGRGIHASGFATAQGGLLQYMRALAERLRRVRVCCGDFERILGPAVTTCIGTTGVFLDPPYPEEGRSICYSHDGDGVWWRAYQWSIDNGDDPKLRIALCGYEHPQAVFPPDWECVAWKASGGYGRSARGKANAERERIWFSPHCLRPTQGMLFEERG